jgi:hypothetical protein
MCSAVSTFDRRPTVLWNTDLSTNLRCERLEYVKSPIETSHRGYRLAMLLLGIHRRLRIIIVLPDLIIEDLGT